MAKKPQEIDTTSEVDDSMEDLGILEFDQNLEDYEEPDLLPKGNYNGEIQGVAIKLNQKGTGKYFAIKFVIPTSEFPPDYDLDNYPEGCAVYYNLISVPSGGNRRAMSNLKKFVSKMGLTIATNVIDPNDWMNQRLKLKIDHSTYRGNTNENIASIEAVD